MTKPRLVLLCIAATIACGGPSPQPHETHQQRAADPLTAEKAAFERARPVFVARCSRCHSKDGKDARPISLEHFDMTSYPFGGHHTETITTTLRNVVGLDGSKPKMPQDNKGSLTEDQLALIEAWAAAYDAAEAGGAHEAAP